MEGIQPTIVIEFKIRYSYKYQLDPETLTYRRFSPSFSFCSSLYRCHLEEEGGKVCPIMISSDDEARASQSPEAPQTPLKMGQKRKAAGLTTAKVTELGSPFKKSSLSPSLTKKTHITALVPVVTASGALATKDVKDEEDDPFAPFIAKDDNNNLMDLNSIRVITLPESCEATLEHVKDLYLVLIQSWPD
ncbi:hypothetical protein FA15DRAFT_709018 [Coprinopsis marcescibilis]|uniref:Uncharacterized protein n=1 Tax=Coprinopsis marcescibilis TaxID=230819 RepID=A0A5C3KH43_COPMA|nr:hypothetical protein FA15DRAFT_709018 [Coprinopsis marcescibilis]